MKYICSIIIINLLLLTSCATDECECDKNYYENNVLVNQSSFEIKSTRGQFQIMGDDVFFGTDHLCDIRPQETPYERNDTIINGTDTTIIFRELKYDCDLH